MPRASTLPRVTGLGDAADNWFVHTIDPYRPGAADPGTMACYLDPTPAGVERAVAAAGTTSEAASIAIYLAPTSDLRVGDAFVHNGDPAYVLGTDTGGVVYKVIWCGPQAAHPVDGTAGTPTIKLAIAEASRSREGATA